MNTFEPKEIVSKLEGLEPRLRLSLLSKFVSTNEDTMKKYFINPMNRFYIDSDTLLPHFFRISKIYKAVDYLIDINKDLDIESLKKANIEISDAIVAIDDGDFNIKNLSAQYAFYSYCNLIKYSISTENKLLKTIIVQTLSAKFPFVGKNEMNRKTEEDEINAYFSEWWLANKP